MVAGADVDLTICDDLWNTVVTIPGGRFNIVCGDWWGTASYSDQNYGDLALANGTRLGWWFGARAGSWWVYVFCDDKRSGYENRGLEGVMWLAFGSWGANDPPRHMPSEVATTLITESLTRFCAGEPPWKAPDNLHYTIDPEGQP